MKSNLDPNAFIVTTTENLSGFAIKGYFGIVSGHSVLGANFMRDFFARVTDVVGGSSDSYETVLRDARERATLDIKRQAAALGANAVLSVHVDYDPVGKNSTIMMCNVTGTAALVQQI